MVLKAVILVGGHGTRLRPLTFTKSKPLVEFCNQPIVGHQIDALVKAGVKHIILCVSFKQDSLEKQLSEKAKAMNIKIDFSVEDKPMGTGGPLALAAKLLDTTDSDPFFMLNADVSSIYPFSDLLAYHKKHGKEGTILVTKVQDPSKYGVVVFNESGQVERFVEKPQIFVGDKINAGMYILNKSILKRIPNKPTSIEREVFPHMAKDKELYAMVLPDFWMDIGQPKDYIAGQRMKLANVRKNTPERLAKGDEIKGNVLIDKTAKYGKNCLLGPDVVIGPNVTIADGVRLQDCTILSGTTIDQSAYVCNSIVGWNNKIGKWARVQDMCVFGEDVKVKDNLFVRSLMVCPHKGVKNDNLEDGKIILGLN